MIEYRTLQPHEIVKELFTHFNRYQNVTRCWRKENGAWLLKGIVFEENWNEQHFLVLVKCLKNTLATGGTVYGAFHNETLAGFSSVENIRFGSNKEYLQLSCIHVSYEYRGNGIGKKLFLLSANKARQMGAKKLYISAHSSEESQAFYKSMQCYEALEYNQRLVSEEPFDCQLEYLL